MQNDLVFGVSEFVEYVNQTFEMAFPFVAIEGELSNFRVSRGKWVYFDLKDATAMVRCFATVYALSGPFEDGMVVRVQGSPRLHPMYNFTFNVQSITPVGEGNIRKQAELLRAKLEAEGLFDPSRKRALPVYPKRIALIAAGQSAAYADFVKIARARWSGLHVEHYEVQVQGEQAPEHIVRALQQASAQAEIPEAIVMIRGGGSAEDLAAFNDERVVRSVAASRVPTVIAIGHEIDLSLAELAADLHASTPSNAAELLLPDKHAEKRHIQSLKNEIDIYLNTLITHKKQHLAFMFDRLNAVVIQKVDDAAAHVLAIKPLLEALDPRRPLSVGYALIHNNKGALIKTVNDTKTGDEIMIELLDGYIDSQAKAVRIKEEKHA